MSTIRAKMIVNSVMPSWGGSQVVSLNAVYNNKDGSRAEENKAFSSATPSGTVSLHITADAPAFDKFKSGGTYYVDFTPVEE